MVVSSDSWPSSVCIDGGLMLVLFIKYSTKIRLKDCGEIGVLIPNNSRYLFIRYSM